MQDNRFTVYDVMEKKGLFKANPANQAAGAEYVRQEFPKMLYHPMGEERIIVSGTIEMTLMGPIKVGEQREIIWKIVKDKVEEKELLTEGWHTHPSRAIAAGGGEAPPMSSDERIRELESQLAAQTAELAEAKSGMGL